MKQLIDFEEIVLKVRSTQIKRGIRKPAAVAIFDLPGSTPLKLERGHYEGTRRALSHNLLCKEISNAFGGKVIKELGDGVLVIFPDGIKACRSAIAIKQGLKKLGKIETKGGIAFGHVEEVRINRIPDILSDTVDRCARLQALAQAGQILVDRSLRDAVQSQLKDYPDIRLSAAIKTCLKGIGDTEVYELSTSKFGFLGPSALKGVFSIYEEGRLSLGEKVSFIEGARNEVIELGIALSTFADYFIARKPSEFKEPVAYLLAKGVSFKCLALDPQWKHGKLYAQDRREPEYIAKILESIKTLKAINDEFLKQRLPGSFEMYVYSHFPYFHAVCVDGEDRKAGRLTVSHYMCDTPRAKCPVLQFSRTSHLEMFKTYWASIKHLLADSRRLW